MDRRGNERSGAEQRQVEWSGLREEWRGEEWRGAEQRGLNRRENERSGPEWSGVVRRCGEEWRLCGASAVHVLLVRELTSCAVAAGTVFVLSFW